MIEKGRADYVLFAGLTPTSVVEAKKENTNVAGKIPQAERYSKSLIVKPPKQGAWELAGMTIACRSGNPCSGGNCASHSEAVAEDWRIDHEPPIRFDTLLTQNGITFAKGEKVIVNKPRDLTREQMKEIKLLLDNAGYSEAKLQSAVRSQTNQDIAASIIDRDFVNNRVGEQGVAASIPNEAILINTLALQEAKDSSEVENIVTTHDELYKANLFEEAITNSTRGSSIQAMTFTRPQQR